MRSESAAVTRVHQTDTPDAIYSLAGSFAPNAVPDSFHERNTVRMAHPIAAGDVITQ